MATTKEVETKFELRASDFERLKTAAHVTGHVEQRNIYFDKAWRLADLAATFRLRITHEDAAITLKLPTSWAHNTRTATEVEWPVTESGLLHWLESAQFIDVEMELPPELGERLLRLGVNTLQRVGEVQNNRYLAVVDDIGRLELDQLFLPNGAVVYEVEIESVDLAVHEQLTQWIYSAVPEARPSTTSKFQRFRMAALRQVDALDVHRALTNAGRFASTYEAWVAAVRTSSEHRTNGAR